MHYYKRNLGDYAQKAGRLSMLQHGSYTLLLDACYDREQFPTLEEAIEWTWASTTEEVEAVKFVLSKFFKLENGVYVQKRIEEEIKEYQSKAEQNRQIAIARETKRKQNSTKRVEDSTNGEQVVNESPPNQEPLTNNHKPIIKTHSSVTTTIGEVCASIKTLFDTAKRPITDINQANPTFIACIEAGATMGEFLYAASIAIEKNKGFNYLVGIVAGQRQNVSKLNLHQGNMPNQAVNIAAKSVFKPEHTQHLMGNTESEVKDAKQIAG